MLETRLSPLILLSFKAYALDFMLQLQVNAAIKYISK